MEQDMKRPGIMIAAPGSGSGKTTFTTGLLAALSARGETVYAYKCGPDYIDPMYHMAALREGQKQQAGWDQKPVSRNLDTFFTDDQTTRRLYLEDPDDGYHIVEGVMGLYDGVAGTEEQGSSYDLARALGLPIILVVNARGQGRSLAALLAGFQKFDVHHLIRGVVLNQTSKEMYLRLAPLIESETGLACLGYLPKDSRLEAPSRHLGLLAPGELPEAYIRAARETVEQQLDWERFFRIASAAERPNGEMKADPNDRSDDKPKNQTYDKSSVRLAVARDAAFSFCYADNLRMLERAGAELVFFSLLADAHLPERIDGLLLSGGYPELYAEQLSENSGMLRDIRDAVRSGLPTVAECGGFLYLQQELQGSDGQMHPMVGVLPGMASNQGRPVRFGYAMIREKSPIFLPEGTICRGHEFHYYDSTENGSSCLVEKPVTGRSWEAVFTTETLWAGFPHVYYPACPEFVESFISRMKRYSQSMEEYASVRSME